MLLVLLAVAVLFGAVIIRSTDGNDKPVRVDLVPGAAGAVLFRFSYCDGRGIPVLHLVEVFHPGDVNREECAISRENGPYRPVPEWRLGAPMAGFRIRGCESLPPGDYRVSVLGPGQSGTTTFRISSGGSVTQTSRPCG